MGKLQPAMDVSLFRHLFSRTAAETMPFVKSPFCAWCNERVAESVVTDHGVDYHVGCYERRRVLLLELGAYPPDLNEGQDTE